MNCGHCAPLLFRASGAGVSRLSDGGPVLGLLPQARFEPGVERLEQGDVLVLYSDGVVEAAERERRGVRRGSPDRRGGVGCGMPSPSEIRDRILRAVRAFTGSDVLADDQTLLAIRYTGAGCRGFGDSGRVGVSERNALFVSAVSLQRRACAEEEALH